MLYDLNVYYTVTTLSDSDPVIVLNDFNYNVTL